MPEDNSPCRDFERGVCTRGDKCKYFHPESTSPAEGGKLPTCKDFQNKECLRSKCKFLHITHAEEEEYNKSGTLPEHGGKPEPFNPSRGGQDVCKDFLNGVCNRGSHCKFSHVSEMGYGGAMDMYGKRPRVDAFYGGGEPNRPAIMEENEMLKHKITGLQKEVTDLRQMNDTLYEQNAKYRTHLGGKGGTSIAASQVNTYCSGAVTYPQYSQTAYPSAAMPIAASVPGVGAYSAYTY